MAFGTIKFTGLGTVKAKLRQIAQQAPEHSARTMRRGAERIVKTAKLYCPHDSGALEDSIHAEEGKNEGNGRLFIDIVAGGEVDGVDTDKYAVLVHENYESMKPGPGTLAKMEANPGVVIGSKFVTRAAADNEENLMKKMIETIEEIIEE